MSTLCSLVITLGMHTQSPCFPSLRLSPTTLQFIPNFYKFYRDATTEESIATMQAFIKRLEEVIVAHNNGFLGGSDAPDAADYLAWPWFERLPAVLQMSPGT